MAHNNFTPIPFGSAATSGSINGPMEQLSDAIDQLKIRENTAESNITALQTAVVSKIPLPIFCQCTSASSDTSKLCRIDLTAYGAKDNIKAGDLFLVTMINGSVGAASEMRVQYDGTTIKRANVNNLPANVARGAVLLFVYDGTYFYFAGYTSDPNYEE